MIEPALYAALGACLATLAGLMVLPLLWRRAVRLTTRRLADRLPVSVSEIVAAQDRLRAEHAVALRAVERRAEAAGAQVAREKIAAGQAHAQELGLKNEIAALRLSLELLETQEAVLRGDLDRSGAAFAVTEKALQDAQAAAKTAADERDSARSEAEALRRTADGLRDALAAAQATAAASRAELADAAKTLAETRGALASAERRAAEADLKLTAEASRLADTQAARLAAERRLVDETATVVALRAGAGRLPASAAAGDGALPQDAVAALRARLDEVADAIVRAAAERTPERGSPQPAAEPRRRDALVGGEAR